MNMLAKADPSNYSLTILRSKLDAKKKQSDREQLIVRVSRWGYLEPGRMVPEGRLLAAWRGGKAKHISDFEWVGRGGAPGSVYAVPIPSNV